MTVLWYCWRFERERCVQFRVIVPVTAQLCTRICCKTIAEKRFCVWWCRSCPHRPHPRRAVRRTFRVYIVLPEPTPDGGANTA